MPMPMNWSTRKKNIAASATSQESNSSGGGSYEPGPFSYSYWTAAARVLEDQ